MIAGEGSRKAPEPSGKASEGQWIAPAPDPIGTVRYNNAPEIKLIAPMTETIAPLPDSIAPEIDLITTETEVIAPPVKN